MSAESTGFDVRGVANFVLDVAERDRVPVSNLHLNKILYFMHADSLIEDGWPMIDAKIEAWTYGPVFREVYHGFKQYGDSRITGRLHAFDRQTEKMRKVFLDLSDEEAKHLTMSAKTYIDLPAGLLVDLSHTEGGPWYRVWNHEEELNVGMEITDANIFAHELVRRERFQVQ